MALKNCRECSKEVSNKAKTCPNCGIHNPAKGKSQWLWRVMIFVVLLLVLVVLIFNYYLSPIWQAGFKSIDDVSYTHHYVEHKLWYTYEGGLSSKQIENGQAAPDLISVAYFGSQFGVYQFAIMNGDSVEQLIECEMPCEFADASTYGKYSGERIRKERIKIVPDSVGGAVVDDIKHDALKQIQLKEGLVRLEETRSRTLKKVYTPIKEKLVSEMINKNQAGVVDKQDQKATEQDSLRREKCIAAIQKFVDNSKTITVNSEHSMHCTFDKAGNVTDVSL